MRLTPRLGFRLILVVFAVVVICVRLIPRHRVGPAGSRVISDLAATSPLNQPGGDPALAEAYEVYSALYQAPSQPPNQEPLVFANNSVTDIPQVGGSCLKPTTPDEREMTDAFVAANQQSHRWEQKFTIPQGYRLLDSSEVAQAQNCIVTHGQDSAGCAGYQQVRHIRFLGVPGFDRTHTLWFQSSRTAAATAAAAESSRLRKPEARGNVPPPPISPATAAGFISAGFCEIFAAGVYSASV
jgi:hypothetical protein